MTARALAAGLVVALGMSAAPAQPGVPGTEPRSHPGFPNGRYHPPTARQRAERDQDDRGYQFRPHVHIGGFGGIGGSTRTDLMRSSQPDTGRIFAPVRVRPASWLASSPGRGLGLAAAAITAGVGAAGAAVRRKN